MVISVSSRLSVDVDNEDIRPVAGGLCAVAWVSRRTRLVVVVVK